MKTSKFIIPIFLISVFSFTLLRCSDDDPVPAATYTISGSVTYPNFGGSSTAAAGAVIYMQTSATEVTSSYDVTAVADVNGNYTFKNLLPGTYSVWAAFDDHNTNVPARVDRVYFTAEGALITITAENQTADFAMVSMGQGDAVAVNTIDGDWNQDISHSNVDFEFPYDEENATYTGRFNAFDFGVKFDPADLAGSVLTASIDVLSINTASPGGRDALYTAEGEFWQDTDGSYDLGCVSGTFGVSDPSDATRYATFESETIVVYGDGYLATGPMTFNGTTSNIQFFFKYLPGFQATPSFGPQILTQYSSFEGYFEFAALDVFGIESSHVGGNNVTVRISDQVTKPI